MPPRRKKIFYLLIATILVILFANFEFASDVTLPTGKTFTITKGEGLSTIADNLQKEGIITNPFWFKIYAVIEGRRSNFLAGTFFLPQKTNIKILVKMLTNAEFTQLESQITLIEGWTAEDIADYLTKKQLVEKKDFLQYLNDNALKNEYPILKDRPTGAGLEGYLHPDTYRVYQATTAEEIVRKTLDNLEQKLTPKLRDKIKTQGSSVFKILTMASIIEKEMTGAENKKIAAGIFWKRIKEGYPLQSDATINYITKKGMSQPLYKDLEIDNPYNTYKNYGLPPGPICNPGIESIIAATEPTITPYYYFLTTKTGEVIFSKTYDEHLRNKQKYLK
jgi:UPF0755 protein